MNKRGFRRSQSNRRYGGRRSERPEQGRCLRCHSVGREEALRPVRSLPRCRRRFCTGQAWTLLYTAITGWSPATNQASEATHLPRGTAQGCPKPSTPKTNQRGAGAVAGQVRTPPAKPACLPATPLLFLLPTAAPGKAVEYGLKCLSPCHPVETQVECQAPDFRLAPALMWWSFGE